MHNLLCSLVSQTLLPSILPYVIPLQDAKGFVNYLLDFIGSNAQYLYSLMQMTASDVDTSKQSQHAKRLKHVEMALDALYNVIHNNSGVEVQCIGHFKLLFSLLKVQGASKLQILGLKVSTAQVVLVMQLHVHVHATVCTRRVQ